MYNSRTIALYIDVKNSKTINEYKLQIVQLVKYIKVFSSYYLLQAVEINNETINLNISNAVILIFVILFTLTTLSFLSSARQSDSKSSKYEYAIKIVSITTNY